MKSLQIVTNVELIDGKFYEPSKEQKADSSLDSL